MEWVFIIIGIVAIIIVAMGVNRIISEIYKNPTPARWKILMGCNEILVSAILISIVSTSFLFTLIWCGLAIVISAALITFIYAISGDV